MGQRKKEEKKGPVGCIDGITHMTTEISIQKGKRKSGDGTNLLKVHTTIKAQHDKNPTVN